jgi:hypothetical protein
MDGLLRSIGDGLTGLVGGAVDAVGSAIGGIGEALGAALPAGALPVIGIAGALVLLWLVLKR